MVTHAPIEGDDSAVFRSSHLLVQRCPVDRAARQFDSIVHMIPIFRHKFVSLGFAQISPTVFVGAQHAAPLLARTSAPLPATHRRQKSHLISGLHRCLPSRELAVARSDHRRSKRRQLRKAFRIVRKDLLDRHAIPQLVDILANANKLLQSSEKKHFCDTGRHTAIVTCGGTTSQPSPTFYPPLHPNGCPPPFATGAGVFTFTHQTAPLKTTTLPKRQASPRMLRQRGTA